MKLPRGLVVGCSLTALVVAIAGSGCERGASSTPGPAPVSPEESFKSILETIRRGLELGAGGVISGGVAHQDGGYTALSVNNKVSGEYSPPAKEGEPHRATISVESESQVIIQRSPDRDDTAARRRDSGASDLDVDILDPETVALSSGSSNRRPVRSPVSELPISPKPNRVAQSHELIHRNGRWELVAPIDKEADEAVFTAFEYALRTQL